ncbi:hypothetical protein ACFV3R_16970 [Streptomyces sp. NPDC059740]
MIFLALLLPPLMLGLLLVMGGVEDLVLRAPARPRPQPARTPRP